MTAILCARKTIADLARSVSSEEGGPAKGGGAEHSLDAADVSGTVLSAPKRVSFVIGFTPQFFPTYKNKKTKKREYGERGSEKVESWLVFLLFVCVFVSVRNKESKR